jgi:hypothetical protein
MRRLCALLVVATVLAPAIAFAQLSRREGGPRIRPTDSRLAELLQQGIDRSPTVRRLVEQIESGNVVVYLQSEQSMRGLLLGALTWIGANDSLRFMRATIKVRPKSNALVASIAHELQHVVEVVNAPWVTSDRSLRALYRTIGKRTSVSDEVWDTAEARWTTLQVLRELNASAAEADADDER